MVPVDGPGRAAGSAVARGPRAAIVVAASLVACVQVASAKPNGLLGICPSRIRCQAATGSWTKSRQWETQRTLFSSARATVWPPAKVDGVWPFNDAWLRTSLEEARRQAPRNVASILDSARRIENSRRTRDTTEISVRQLGL